MMKIKCVGQILDENVMKPDPARESAIKNMPSPTNVSYLQAFLGCANYVLIPNNHFSLVSLNDLEKKKLQLQLDG